MVAVAQLVRAPDCGSGGRGFKSPQPPSAKRRIELRPGLNGVQPAGRWRFLGKESRVQRSEFRGESSESRGRGSLAVVSRFHIPYSEFRIPNGPFPRVRRRLIRWPSPRGVTKRMAGRRLGRRNLSDFAGNHYSRWWELLQLQADGLSTEALVLLVTGSCSLAFHLVGHQTGPFPLGPESKSIGPCSAVRGVKRWQRSCTSEICPTA